jgi:hypothetical protein
MALEHYEAGRLEMVEAFPFLEDFFSLEITV